MAPYKDLEDIKQISRFPMKLIKVAIESHEFVYSTLLLIGMGSASVIILSWAATIVHAASSLQFSALMCAKSKRNYGRQQLLSAENVKSKHFFFNSFIKFILNFNPILTVKAKIFGFQFATYERQMGIHIFRSCVLMRLVNRPYYKKCTKNVKMPFV